MMIQFFFFFFQAEDGIRDYKVTGVQTCALPIYVWVLLSLGEMVEVGLIAVAARRHGEGLPDAAARAAGAAVLYALAAGAVVSAVGLVLGDELFQVMTVPPEVARLGHDYLSTWLVGGPLVFGFFAVQATFRASWYP